MIDCAEDHCTRCYGKEKTPLAIEEICPHSSQPLVAAVYLQDITSVTARLPQDPNLANSWDFLKASNYKARKCCLPDSAASVFSTIEPLLLFAATTHQYKKRKIYSSNVPEESIGIVRAIAYYGGRIPTTSPTGDPRAAWHNACSQYGTTVQYSPAIMEICIQAGNDLKYTEDTVECPRTMLSDCWRGTLQCAAKYDADRSLGLFLDGMLAQGCSL